MELYILDNLYRRVGVVDQFESVIWSERFKRVGDFQLTVLSTLENRTRFVPGIRLAHRYSRRVMTIETIEDSVDDEGRAILTIKGPSLEDILRHRLAVSALTDLETNPKWILTGTPLAIGNQLFHDICVTGILNPGDIISGVTEDSIYPTDTIAPPEDSYTYDLDPKDLYSALTGICDPFNMGFRLVRDLDTSMLYFDIYMGSDRTTQQTGLAAVVFSPDLENLRSTRKLTSVALYKNVAYVISKVGHEIVYQTDIDPDVEGFERRVLFVKADDIDDPDGPTASAQMIRRGKEALANAVRFTALDGELAVSSKYKYERDYYLGDLVELRDGDGVTNQMQVTEQIFVSDKEGDRSYPTLAVNIFITPGSWLAWDYGQVWDDVDISEHWDDQP